MVHDPRASRVKSSIGMDGFRIDKMLASTGNVTLDPGLHTASCESEITHIDGDVGILRYRGYRSNSWQPTVRSWRSPIFLFMASSRTRRLLRSSLAALSVIRCCTRTSRLSSPAPAGGHPMSILQSGVAGLATYYDHTIDQKDPAQLDSGYHPAAGQGPR